MQKEVTKTLEVSETQGVFHVEELENRFEMAAIDAPNWICWVIIHNF